MRWQEVAAGAILGLGAFLLLGGHVEAANDADGVVLFDDENGNFGWTWTTSTGTAIGLVEIRRFADLNNDGDFSDANENILVGSATSCPGINAGEVLSCQLATANAGRSIVVFKNQSVEHVPGNFSLKVELHNGVGAVVDSVGYSVFIRPGSASTFGQVQTEHGGTRGLVNQSYANLTTFGVPCSANCSAGGGGNATDNMTHAQLLANLTVDEGGGHLALLGHTNPMNLTVAPDISVAKALLMVVWFALFLLAAREGWLWVLSAGAAIIGFLSALTVGTAPLAHSGAAALYFGGVVLAWVAEGFHARRQAQREREASL